jgi:hypothetical protein
MMDDDYVSLKQAPPLHSGDSGDEPDIDSSESEEDIVFERDTRSDDSASFDGSVLSSGGSFVASLPGDPSFNRKIATLQNKRVKKRHRIIKTGYTELGLDQKL